MKEAAASLEDERKKWAAELGDRTIEFWTPQVTAATATATASATVNTTTNAAITSAIITTTIIVRISANQYHKQNPKYHC